MNFSPARNIARWMEKEEENAANRATSTYWTESYSSWFFGLVFFARFLSLLNFMCLTFSINVNEVKLCIYNHTCDHLFVLFCNLEKKILLIMQLFLTI